MKLNFFYFILFLLTSNISHSTSTTFDQNFIIKNDADPLNLNTNKSLLGVQSIALTGSISFLGEKLYKSGFFSPFGLIPENIINLSPMVYQIKKKNLNSLNFHRKCFDRYLFNRKVITSEKYFNIDYDKDRDCDLNDQSKSKNISSLIDRYF